MDVYCSDGDSVVSSNVFNNNDSSGGGAAAANSRGNNDGCVDEGQGAGKPKVTTDNADQRGPGYRPWGVIIIADGASGRGWHLATEPLQVVHRAPRDPDDPCGGARDRVENVLLLHQRGRQQQQ